MKCRFAESRQLSRRLLEDDLPADDLPTGNGPPEDFGLDDEALLGNALAGLSSTFEGQPADYSYWKEKIGRRGRRKLKNNTYASLERYPHEHIVFRLHATVILEMYPDGSFVVNDGGWRTRLTLARINDYLPPGWSIYTHLGTWYWHRRNKVGSIWDRNPAGRIIQEYTSGDSVDGNGVLHAQKQARHMKPIRTRKSKYE